MLPNIIVAERCRNWMWLTTTTKPARPSGTQSCVFKLGDCWGRWNAIGSYALQTLVSFHFSIQVRKRELYSPPVHKNLSSTAKTSSLTADTSEVPAAHKTTSLLSISLPPSSSSSCIISHLVATRPCIASLPFSAAVNFFCTYLYFFYYSNCLLNILKKLYIYYIKYYPSHLVCTCITFICISFGRNFLPMNFFPQNYARVFKILLTYFKFFVFVFGIKKKYVYI